MIMVMKYQLNKKCFLYSHHANNVIGKISPAYKQERSTISWIAACKPHAQLVKTSTLQECIEECMANTFI